MTNSDVRSIQRLGIIVIVVLLLNFWAVHKKEESIRELRIYVQGALAGSQLNRIQNIPCPPPLQVIYEN